MNTHGTQPNGVSRFRLAPILFGAIFGISLLLLILVGRAILRTSDDAPEIASQSALSLHSEQPVAVTVSLPRIETEFVRSKADENRRALEADNDKWDSEAFSESAEAQIRRVAEFSMAASIDDAALAEMLAGSFECGALRPAKLATVFEDHAFTIYRSMEPLPISSGAERFQDAAGLQKALIGWAKPFANCQNIHTKIKTTSTRLGANGQAETVHVIHTSGHRHSDDDASDDDASDDDASGEVEQHADWRCRWTTSDDGVPRLVAIELEAYEQSVSRNPSPMFEDVTLAVFGDQPVYHQQLAHGLDHWLARIETTHGMYLFAEYGIAIGDINGDDLEDVYVCQPGGLPNRLLIQNLDGTVSDQSRDAKVDWLDHSSSALLVDFDNDGDLDLAIATEDRCVLIMENDSTGQFSLSSRLAIEDRHVQGLCAADYDNDGDVDLYLTVAFADQRARQNESKPEFVYHDANEGGANVLFRNDSQRGELSFADVTRQVGLDVNNRRHSLAAAWEDFDNDGDQDLYVANDYGQNCLYQNDGGRFREIAGKSGVVDFGSGMSVGWSDYDRDGDMDLYVGNMFSSAGNRITSQAAFRPKATAETRQLLSRFAKGNTLFRNDLVGSARDSAAFVDLSHESGLQRGRWAWSSVFADLNNDGWDDVLVANGYMTRDETKDL